MTDPKISVMTVGPIGTNCYSVSCPLTGKVLLIDPGGDPELILENVASADLLVYTHGHFDHAGGAGSVVARLAPRTLLHPNDRAMFDMVDTIASQWGFSAEKPPAPEGDLSDGLVLNVGELSFTVLHTPGHSPGSVCLLGHGSLFSGDTLFAGSIGRTDLPESSGRDMQDSLRKLMRLVPGETAVYPGHGPSTTMAEELRSNPFLR